MPGCGWGTKFRKKGLQNGIFSGIVSLNAWMEKRLRPWQIWFRVQRGAVPGCKRPYVGGCLLVRSGAALLNLLVGGDGSARYRQKECLLFFKMQKSGWYRGVSASSLLRDGAFLFVWLLFSRLGLGPGEGFAPGRPGGPPLSRSGARPLLFWNEKRRGRKTFTGTPRDPGWRPVCSRLRLPPLGRKNNSRYFFSWPGRCIPGTRSVGTGAFLQAAPARRTAFLYL